MITLSETVTFDAASHEYRLADGRLVPSVTTILKAVGVTADFDALRASSMRRSQQIDDKRDLGRALHADAHAYDDNDLDWSTVHPLVLPYLQAYATFRDNNHAEPLERERLLYHPLYGYAGTMDGVFRLTRGVHQGKRVLLDLKTGSAHDAAAHLQTAAYEAAYRTQPCAEPIDMRWSVELCPDREIPYRIVPYSGVPERRGSADLHKFLACLTVYWEQPARRTAA